MQNMFESIRVYDGKESVHSCFLSRNEIEFVVSSSKFKQLHAKVFGNVYNLSRSRYKDKALVYCPQNYRDFILFLKGMIVDKDIKVVYMHLGSLLMHDYENKTNAYIPEEIENGGKFLIEYAAEVLKDTSLTKEDQIANKEKFIKKCNQILKTYEVERVSQIKTV